MVVSPVVQGLAVTLFMQRGRHIRLCRTGLVAGTSITAFRMIAASAAVV
jgi:hypothetical protein